MLAFAPPSSAAAAGASMLLARPVLRQRAAGAAAAGLGLGLGHRHRGCGVGGGGGGGGGGGSFSGSGSGSTPNLLPVHRCAGSRPSCSGGVVAVRGLAGGGGGGGGSNSSSSSSDVGGGVAETNAHIAGRSKCSGSSSKTTSPQSASPSSSTAAATTAAAALTPPPPGAALEGAQPAPRAPAPASAPPHPSKNSQGGARVMRVRAVREAPNALLGTAVTVRGWVRSVRDQKACAFVDVNDGSSLAGLQVVIDAASPAFSTVTALTTGCSVTATGTIVESPGKGQRFELQANSLMLVGDADSSYPLQKKRHSLEFLRSIAHLRPRTNSIGAVTRVRSTLAIATHNFFSERGFFYLHAPVITASDCEGAGEMFRVTTAIPADPLLSNIPVIPSREHAVNGEGLAAEGEDANGSALDLRARPPAGESALVDFSRDFFGKPAFLTVSGQLSAETYACALSDVYTFGPTFRAEKSNTTRHLAEFWMIEPEMAFATLEDDMDNAEAFVKSVVTAALERCAPDLEFLDKFVKPGLLDKLKTVVAEPFGRVTYTEAIELLLAANLPVGKKGSRRFTFPVEWGCDLQSEHERYLAEEHFKKPVFVYNYPSTIKAFYMRDNDDDDGRTVQAMDLLVPGIGELIGGSAREERLDVLERKIANNGLDPADYDWYLDLRRYGSIPHAGYGMGFERLVLFVTGMDNIRDVIPYPRYPGSAQF